MSDFYPFTIFSRGEINNQSITKRSNTMNTLKSFAKTAMMLSVMFIFSITVSAQHQHGNTGMGNQGMQMMQKQMGEMQNMMIQMNGLVSKSSMMVSMMKKGDPVQMQSMNNMDMHSKMLPMMQNMESMAKSMDGTLNELNNMMSNKEMMKNEAMSDHIKEMMDQMKAMMNDYDGMLKSMKNAQEKEYK